MNLGAQELMIVMVILLIVFGGGQLPKLARSIGQAKRELTDAAPDDTAPESRSRD